MTEKQIARSEFNYKEDQTGGNKYVFYNPGELCT
jgi:hypothetical protein